MIRNYIQFHELSFYIKGEGIEIKVNSISELKKKIEAFELLFDTEAKIYLSPYDKNYKTIETEYYPDGGKYVYNSKLYSFSFENTKTLNIGTKYIKRDDQKKTNIEITGQVEIILVKTK